MSQRFLGGYLSATYNPLVAGSLMAEALIVAGGGAGGDSMIGISAGGGAGGVLYGANVPLTQDLTYTVTVGSGGAGGASNYPSTQGGNSSITATGISWVAIGGATAPSWNYSRYDGGSGPGTSLDLRGQASGTINNSYGYGNQAQFLPAGFFTPYGNNGGPSSTNSSSILGGGGGGAGAAGGAPNASTNACGNGGSGIQLSITGTATFYAGGGGSNGYNQTSNGTGGAGGGGTAVGSSRNGTANTGGGGGGGDYVGSNNGAGGSGVVIISVPIAFTAVSTTGSPTVTTTATRRIYTFTGSGTFKF